MAEVGFKYCVIKLNDDQETIIDYDDFERIKNYKWFAKFSPLTNSYYVYTVINNKHFSLASFIMNHIPTSKLTVDHINRNSLDNRKINLRIANQNIQTINQNIHKNNTSGTRGVSYECDSKSKYSRWIVQWKENNKNKKKSFSVNKYGYEKAKKRAKKFRHKIETTVENYREAYCLDKNNDHKIDQFDYNLNDLENYFYYEQVKRRIASNNKTGVQGVCYCKFGHRFAAGWYEDGKKKKKYFPIGSEKPPYPISFQKAIDYRNEMKK